MGNTIIFKPPQFGTLLFEPLLEAFRDSFPKGVINTIYAPGSLVVPHLLASGQINVLALIGSSKVADHLKNNIQNLTVCVRFWGWMQRMQPSFCRMLIWT